MYLISVQIEGKMLWHPFVISCVNASKCILYIFIIQRLLEAWGHSVESVHCDLVTHEAGRVGRERPEQNGNTALVQGNRSLALQKLLQHVDRPSVGAFWSSLQPGLDDVHGNGYQPVADASHASRKQSRPDRQPGPVRSLEVSLDNFITGKVGSTRGHISCSSCSTPFEDASQTALPVETKNDVCEAFVLGRNCVGGLHLE